MNRSKNECLDDCLACYRICVETLQYALRQGGGFIQLDLFRLLEDCQEICQVSADFMIRQSEMHPAVCGACAEICQRCADECGRFPNDTTMERCAEACRHCAESCHRETLMA